MQSNWGSPYGYQLGSNAMRKLAVAGLCVGSVFIVAAVFLF
jgi:hypothetical protein